jgi:hypothetical protein
MTDRSDNSHPSDICLLLRCHAEQLGLSSQVVPVLRQLEQPEAVPEEELGAALAYLEVLWIDARRRAAETDAAFAKLIASNVNGNRLLHAEAHEYHAAVLALRDAVARHVAHLTAPPLDAPAARHEHATF